MSDGEKVYIEFGFITYLNFFDAIYSTGKAACNIQSDSCNRWLRKFQARLVALGPKCDMILPFIMIEEIL